MATPTKKTTSKNKISRATPVKDFEALLKNVKGLYSEADLKEIQEVYKSLKSSGKQKARLLRPIVPIREWLDSEYYIGAFKYNVFPFWKEVIANIVDHHLHHKDSDGNPIKINQAIFTGAIGTGKSTAAVILLVRKIYELSCYEHISALFNLGPIARVAFAYLSVTREQAQNTGFAALQEMIDQIPYFTEHFPRKQPLDTALIWPQERLFVMHGSVSNHFIGMNLAGSILDEANFFGGRADDDAGVGANSKVAKLYAQIITRAESRFIVNGVNESLSILVSSSTNVSSFTETMINKASKDPHTIVVSPTLWDVKPWNYKGKRFYVYSGGDGFEPRIIESIDDINTFLAANSLPEIYGVSLDTAYGLLPPSVKSKIIKVPEEHRQAFTNDILIALQDLAGFSSTATRKFFNNYIAYNKSVDKELKHPFSSAEFKISTTKSSREEGFMPISAYLLPNTTFPNLKAPRYMHVDLAATGDSIGISMCHISSWKQVYQQLDTNVIKEDKPSQPSYMQQPMSRFNLQGLFGSYKNEKDEQVISEHKTPILTMDFMLRLNPPAKPERMPISKVRDFILYLHNTMGIRFGKITFDQWGSEQIRSELMEAGFNVGYLSVDKGTDPYYALANLIYEERLKFYHYKTFQDELFNVVEDRVRKKIDHTPDFHKDVADSVAGSVYNAIKADDKIDIVEEDMSQVFISVNTKADPRQQAGMQLTQELLKTSGGVVRETYINGKKVSF